MEAMLQGESKGNYRLVGAKLPVSATNKSAISKTTIPRITARGKLFISKITSFLRVDYHNKKLSTIVRYKNSK